MEAVIASLKTQTASIDRSSIELLLTGNRILRERISSLGAAEMRTVQEGLDALADQIGGREESKSVKRSS